MSFYWTDIFPCDPTAVPSADSTETALAFAREVGWPEPDVKAHDEVTFLDAGEITFEDHGRLDCPLCAYDLLADGAWGRAMDTAFAREPQFSDLRFRCSRCEGPLSLNELPYATGAGFARWRMRFPNHPPVTEAELEALGNEMGHSLRRLFGKG